MKFLKYFNRNVSTYLSFHFDYRYFLRIHFSRIKLYSAILSRMTFLHKKLCRTQFYSRYFCNFVYEFGMK